MNNKNLWFILTALIFVLMIVMVYRAWPILFPAEVLSIEPSANCDLHQRPCEARLPDGGKLRFSITPREIPLIEPLDLRVELEGTEASRVEVDFAGLNMFMGYNRVHLSADDPGTYAGIGRLPVCVQQRMTWEARVLVYTDTGLIAVPHRFVTVKSGAGNP
jgi:hypothetical protein